MKTTLQSAVLLILLACTALPVASKPVYKWVDEHGVVNYTTEPPPASLKVKAVAIVSAKISSFDPVVAGLDANSQQRRNLEYLRNRADQLQNELAGLRYARQAQVNAAEDARRRRLEECQRQRRVDCDTNYYDDGAYGPRVVIGARPVLITGFVPVAVQTPPRVRTPRLAMLR
jgi:hypothetical protein